MHRYIKHGAILGVHPMFGPSAEATGQNITLTPTNGKEARLSSAMGHYLGPKGFRTLVMSPRKHDEMMGTVLFLTYFVGFVTADSWKLLRIQRFSGSSSTSFRFLMPFVSSIVESSPELYVYLQVSVPSACRADRLFVSRAKEWSGLVREVATKRSLPSACLGCANT
ncbi:prephenate dehydrogenase/arogenate dehydrogenase family protein [Candidatus Marsarchaeota archaeon]|nr:prephenate dehydrogenase/arogenate dehydrogenase family protein [Candidatus Marsarchaeota archaeon]